MAFQRTSVIWIIGMVAGGSGCQIGPMKPMPVRLNTEAQQSVDGWWNNMLTPPGRLERGVLLDTITSYGLFHAGVDRLDASAEKQVNGGKVVMVIHFDRTRPPEEDRFVVTCFDAAGYQTRVEHYTRQEIDERYAALWPTNLNQLAAHEGKSAEDKAACEEWQRTSRVRQRQVLAATRPADDPPPPDTEEVEPLTPANGGN